MRMKSIRIWLVLCIIGVINSACGGATPTSTQAEIVPTATPTPLPESSAVITTGNAAQIKELAQLGEGVVRQVAWSADGSQFTAVTDKGAYTFDSSSRKIVRSIRSILFGSAPLLSPDGKLLATNNDDRILVFDLQKALAEQGEPKTKFKFEAVSTSYVFSADSKLLAGVTADNRILCWDLTNGQLRSETPLGEPDLSLFAMTSDGSMFIGIYEYKRFGTSSIHLIDSKDGSEIAILASSTEMMGTPALSPNNKLLAIGNKGETKLGVTEIWDLTTHKVLKTLAVKNYAFAYRMAKFSPDNQRLAIGDDSGTVQIWDVQSGKLVSKGSDLYSNVQAVQSGQTAEVSSMAFSPDSQTLLTAALDSGMKLWNAADKVEIASINDLRSRNNNINISPDGSLFATGFPRTNIIRIWDTKGGRLLSTFEAKSDISAAFDFAFNGINFRILPDNKTLISFSMVGIFEWEIPSGKTLHTFTDEKYWFESPIETSPDGKQLYYYHPDESNISTVFVWDITNQQVTKTFSTKNPLSVNDIAVSADGSLLAAAVGRSVMIWKTANWKVVKTLSGFKNETNVVLFSPDGSRLFTCDLDLDGCQQWSTSTWKKTATYAPAPVYHVWMSGFVLSISPNGQVLAISNGQKCIQLLQATDFTVLKEFCAHTDNVTSLAFTPDGKSLLSSSWDGTIRYWGIP